MNNIWISIVVILIVLFICMNSNCTRVQVKPVETTPVTFVNENPGVTTLGLARFILNEKGEKIDYVLMNLKWNYHIYVVDLEPGVYGVTQYAPEIDKIISYQTITVSNKPMIVKFRRLF